MEDLEDRKVEIEVLDGFLFTTTYQKNNLHEYV
jgi:hypothetical protein